MTLRQRYERAVQDLDDSTLLDNVDDLYDILADERGTPNTRLAHEVALAEAIDRGIVEVSK